jgi:hypothetical protein
MEIAKLILEYVRALIWPITVLTLSLFFRNEIKLVFARLIQLRWSANRKLADYFSAALHSGPTFEWSNLLLGN